MRFYSDQLKSDIHMLFRDPAGPDELTDWLRGHRAIEVLHHIRDTTHREDASRLRTGSAPEYWPPCATPRSAFSGRDRRLGA